MEATRVFSRRVRVTQYLCLRCGHLWIGRKATKPKLCSKCRTAYWDRPPKLQE